MNQINGKYLQALIAFINSHDGCKVEETLPNGQLRVSSIMVDTNKQASRISEQIDATYESARNWLGY